MDQEAINREYTMFLISICGYPKSKQAAQAAKLGWRKSTKAERRDGANDYVKV